MIVLFCIVSIFVLIPPTLTRHAPRVRTARPYSPRCHAGNRCYASRQVVAFVT